jgi:hypothetical protein
LRTPLSASNRATRGRWVVIASGCTLVRATMMTRSPFWQVRAAAPLRMQQREPRRPQMT